MEGFMYVVLVYDVSTNRVTDVCKFLRKHLNWVQNSVFEGELSKSELRKIKEKLKEITDPDEDSVYFYKIRSKKWLDKSIMGQQKSPTDSFI